MNLYRIYRTDEIGYEEYDSAVVAAETEQDAKNMAPHVDNDYLLWNGEGWEYSNCLGYGPGYSCWVHPDHVNVELLGTAKPGTKRGVILASFNAG